MDTTSKVPTQWHYTNEPLKLDESERGNFTRSKLQILIKDTDEIFYDKYTKGIEVSLVNLTDSTVSIVVEENHLDLRKQVYYNNEWRDIESTGSYECGLSYWIVELKTYEYFQSTLPCSRGKVNAEARYILRSANLPIITSRTFESSFNLEELLEKI
ncbi:hypothetical protein GCM10023331_28320 [Algivirga pacifica]|uniref:Uncharacterized protein n=1 Tax=Algivirga pacifica TaxID=1162670 RepID=A0ABP9DE76_9BACT